MGRPKRDFPSTSQPIQHLTLRTYWATYDCYFTTRRMGYVELTGHRVIIHRPEEMKILKTGPEQRYFPLDGLEQISFNRGSIKDWLVYNEKYLAGFNS